MTKASKEPLISVIIPVYNVEEYLDRCLESATLQTYKNIEIILIDDGSTDNSGKMCDEWAQKDKRIKVVHQENKGVSASRNRGICEAKGKLISFIDSDDEAYSDYLETMYCDLTENNCDLAITKHYVKYPLTTKEAFSGATTIFNNPKDCLKEMLLCRDVDVSPWGKLYKKSLFKGVEYPEGKIFEDAATFYSVVFNSKKVILNSTPHYNYIIRRKSISQQYFHKEKLDLIEATNTMCSDIEQKFPDLKAECDVRRMHALLSTLRIFSISKKQSNKTKTELLSLIKEQSKKTKISLLPKRERLALKLLHCYPLFKLTMIIREKRNGTI